MAKTKLEIQKEYEKRTNYAAQAKYKKEKIKRIPLDVQIEEHARIKEHAQKMNESVNGFIKRAIAEAMTSDMKKEGV